MIVNEPILAIDPALATGYAHSDGQSGTLHLPDGAAGLYRMYEWLMLLGQQFKTLAYEEASQGSRNRTTAAYHERLRGVIEMAAHQLCVQTIAINPATWRAQFGLGRKRIAGAPMRACENILGLHPQTDDEAVALMLLDMVRRGDYETKKARTKRIAKKAKKVPRLFR